MCFFEIAAIIPKQQWLTGKNTCSFGMVYDILIMLSQIGQKNEGVGLVHHFFSFTDLVGGIPTPLKNMSSSVGVIVPNIWKNKCSKPPTRMVYW